jgi:hypothetical protein
MVPWPDDALATVSYTTMAVVAYIITINDDKYV